MSKTNTFETEYLQLLFNNTPITEVGDSAGILGSAADGELYVSLHTTSPGEAADQSTNETAYTNYARISVARTSGGWTVSGNSVTNASDIIFAACGATSGVASGVGVGVSGTGAGKMLWYGTLATTLNVASGSTPTFAAGALDLTTD